MTKILTITWKELYTTLVDRNLILIMFLTPIVLSSIMALAFGGLGTSESTVFADIPVAVVNQDAGFDLQSQLGSDAPITNTSLTDLELTISNTVINVGELLLQNPNLELGDAGLDSSLDASAIDFNMGELLANILLSQPMTTTNGVTEGENATGFASINFDNLSCPLLEEEDSNEDENEENASFDSSLDELFNAVAVADSETARAGVDDGTYAAAVIIPAGFSNQLMPLFTFGAEVTGTQIISESTSGLVTGGLVEVYGNTGQSISATIVGAVVEGIVNQFMRVGVALEAVVNTGVTSLTEINLATLDVINPTLLIALLSGDLPSVDASLLDPLACLIVPDAGTVTLQQQPLDSLQEGSSFGIVMVILGSAQAIFFAFFTGVFGVNSIYTERDQWTLQRMLISPTSTTSILAGSLLGNVVVVAVQLLILFLAFTGITSLVELQPLFIWGRHIGLFLLVIIAISLVASGLGVAMVGIARTPQQVQMIGPMLVSLLGALGGSFGFQLPREVSQFSPIWWSSNALHKLAIGETDIGLHLLVLFAISALFFSAGLLLFRRRLKL